MARQKLNQSLFDQAFQAGATRWKNFEFVNVSVQNRQFKGHSFEECTFYKCKWANNDLSGSHFTDCNFLQAGFSECNMEKTVLHGVETSYSEFNQCSFKFSKWDGGQPEDTKFWACDFDQAKLADQNWYLVNFDDVEFGSAAINNSHFKDCDFVKCRFRHTTMVSTNFVDCEMKDPDFRNAEFKDARFIETTIEDGSFGSAHLKDTAFDKVKMKLSTGWAAAGFSGASAIRNSNFTGAKHLHLVAVYDDLDVTGTDFTGTSWEAIPHPKLIAGGVRPAQLTPAPKQKKAIVSKGYTVPQGWPGTDWSGYNTKQWHVVDSSSDEEEGETFIVLEHEVAASDEIFNLQVVQKVDGIRFDLMRDPAGQQSEEGYDWANAMEVGAATRAGDGTIELTEDTINDAIEWAEKIIDGRAEKAWDFEWEGDAPRGERSDFPAKTMWEHGEEYVDPESLKPRELREGPIPEIPELSDEEKRAFAEAVAEYSKLGGSQASFTEEQMERWRRLSPEIYENPRSAKALMGHCQLRWEIYDAKPTKKNLMAFGRCIGRMKASKSARVKQERRRALRAFRSEMKSQGWKMPKTDPTAG
jgi:fluoroquinolone resistance protein